MKAKLKVVAIMAVCFCALSFCARPAQATLITIAIEAEIYSVGDPYNFFGGNIKVGDIIKGSYSYDTDTPDSSPSVTVGRYEYSPPHTHGIFLSISGFDFETDMSNVDFRIDIFNDSISGSDAYGLISYSNLPLVSGTNVDVIWWWLEDYSATALTSDALSTKAPDIDVWQFNRLMIHGPDRGKSFSIEAHVISAIPEPGTILLLGLGTMLLRKRR